MVDRESQGHGTGRESEIAGANFKQMVTGLPGLPSQARMYEPTGPGHVFAKDTRAPDWGFGLKLHFRTMIDGLDGTNRGESGMWLSWG